MQCFPTTFLNKKFRLKISKGIIHSEGKYTQETFICVVYVLWILGHEGESIIIVFISQNPGRK